MRRSGVLLIVLGVLLAGLSSVGVYSMLQRPSAPPPSPIVTVKVVVAAQNIPDRTILQASMLTLKDWPQDLTPTGAVNKTQDLVGKVTAGILVTGEPVLLSKVSIDQQAIGLAPILPPGLVAMVLAMSPVNAVGGAIRTGDAVDVLVSTEYSIYNADGDESKPMQATFYTIQDVPILAIGGQTGSADTGGGNPLAGGGAGAVADSGAIMVTILVTPQDALLLKYAREKGSIDLVLRSPQFHEQVVTDPVYLEYVVRRFELPTPLLIRRQTQTTPSGESQ
jgi:pilus assembly protein CpaB